MSEWLKVPLSKSGVVTSHRGFESHPLRQPMRGRTHLIWKGRIVGLVRATGNRVGGYTVSRVRIPPLPPDQINPPGFLNTKSKHFNKERVKFNPGPARR